MFRLIIACFEIGAYWVSLVSFLKELWRRPHAFLLNDKEKLPQLNVCIESLFLKLRKAEVKKNYEHKKVVGLSWKIWNFLINVMLTKSHVDPNSKVPKNKPQNLKIQRIQDWLSCKLSSHWGRSLKAGFVKRKQGLWKVRARFMAGASASYTIPEILNHNLTSEMCITGAMETHIDYHKFHLNSREK